MKKISLTLIVLMLITLFSVPALAATAVSDTADDCGNTMSIDSSTAALKLPMWDLGRGPKLFGLKNVLSGQTRFANDNRWCLLLPINFVDTKVFNAWDPSYNWYDTTYRGKKLAEDGYFGPATASAVKAFQTATGCSPIDGKVGSGTWGKIQSQLWQNRYDSSYCYYAPLRRGTGAKTPNDIVAYGRTGTQTWWVHTGTAYKWISDAPNNK